MNIQEALNQERIRGERERRRAENMQQDHEEEVRRYQRELRQLEEHLLVAQDSERQQLNRVEELANTLDAQREEHQSFKTMKLDLEGRLETCEQERKRLHEALVKMSEDNVQFQTELSKLRVRAEL